MATDSTARLALKFDAIIIPILQFVMILEIILLT